MLLAYSKLIFVSINLLFAIYTYDSSGEAILNSTVLLFDTNVKFFSLWTHSLCCPCLIYHFVFVLPPPLLLLFYPTKFFRKLLRCRAFKRWDVLNFIMDIFQGWYKDGTQGTQDYRSVSALYLLLRILIASNFVAVVINSNNDKSISNWQIIGIFHIFLGTFFLMLQPYKKSWMNHADGLSLLVDIYYWRCCWSSDICFHYLTKYTWMLMYWLITVAGDGFSKFLEWATVALYLTYILLIIALYLHVRRLVCENGTELIDSNA